MATLESDQLTTSRELAESFNIPPELIGKVLQQLAKSDFIRSVQGVRGGYQLAKSPDKINLTHIIQVVDGPIRVVKCVDSARSCTCDQLDFCNIRNPMETLQLLLVDALSKITLKDLQEINFTINFSPRGLSDKSNVTVNFTNN